MATPEICITSASGLSLEVLAELFTRSFEAYYYPGITSAHTLARRVATEQIDLLRSVVLRVDGEPAGVALLARRGERLWCGGFGITMAYRGRGLAYRLAEAMVAEAREAGAEGLTLEVLTRNSAALKVYERAGMQITRRLLIVAWRPDDARGGVEAPPLEAADPAELVLCHFAALHPAPAAWQREPATLLALPELRGLALREGGETVAYALVQGEESLRLQDFAARDEPTARRLIAALQADSRAITSVNEPAASPLTPAFLRSGFVVADEQHELALAL
jgi:RimJ/RimL family protein N-acetyltransferase